MVGTSIRVSGQLFLASSGWSSEVVMTTFILSAEKGYSLG